ncbi:MAG: stage V sporulation protein S [Thermotogae bacterium]|nr:stage V sporulation protein S [Thermotogota bacterium]
MEILKVSSNSNPNKVAGAIAGALGKNSMVELQAIGAGAVNQAVKAVVIANRFLGEQGKKLFMVPGFIDIEVDGKVRTGMSIKVYLDEKK